MAHLSMISCTAGFSWCHPWLSKQMEYGDHQFQFAWLFWNSDCICCFFSGTLTLYLCCYCCYCICLSCISMLPCNLLFYAGHPISAFPKSCDIQQFQHLDHLLPRSLKMPQELDFCRSKVRHRTWARAWGWCAFCAWPRSHAPSEW